MAQRCSIVICTRNSLPYLKKCISALRKIDFENYEIIIVNDGSGDETKEYLEGIKNDKIRVVNNNKNLGLSRSRNIDIKTARYDILAFIDDDCTDEKVWLKNLLRGFTDAKTGFVIG